MDKREHEDFDLRLNAEVKGPQRPSQGEEQLWGLMGRPGVAPGIAPQAPAPAAARARRPAPSGRKVGEAP